MDALILRLLHDAKRAGITIERRGDRLHIPGRPHTTRQALLAMILGYHHDEVVRLLPDMDALSGERDTGLLN